MSRKDKYKSREELLTKVAVLRDETKEAYREMDKANSKLEKLKQENEELQITLNHTNGEREKAFLHGGEACFAIIMSCVLVFLLCKSFFTEDKFVPATDALEDAFISTDSEYKDGQHVFDFDGYMKKNGFKFDYQYISDGANDGYISRYYKKGDIRIELEISLDYGKYDLDSDTRSDLVTSRIRIDLDYGAAGPDYIAGWSCNSNDMSLDEFVHDDDSTFFFHREALLALDNVLKSENLKNSYRCPFAYLGIKHQVVNNSIFSPHDD